MFARELGTTTISKEKLIQFLDPDSPVLKSNLNCHPSVEFQETFDSDPDQDEIIDEKPNVADPILPKKKRSKQKVVPWLNEFSSVCRL